MILVRNQTVQDLLTYLQSRPEEDLEADRLYHELLADQTEADYEELKAEGKLPSPNQTKRGAWIV